MKKNNTTNTTTTNNNTNKEDKGMKKMSVFTAFRISGYALGYSVTTVKLNAKEIGRKVKESACGEAFATGYAEAEDKATERFYEKCAKKAEKKQKKADEKAAEEALNEMFESMMDDEEEEEIEESTPKKSNPKVAPHLGPVENRIADKSLLGQNMMDYFMAKENGWHLAFDDETIIGAVQYAKTSSKVTKEGNYVELSKKAYVFQEGAEIAKHIPNGWNVRYYLKGTSTIVAFEYPDGTRVDLFDNGFIVTK